MRGLLIGILSFVMLLAGCSRSVDSRLVRVSQLADCNATDSALAVLGNVCRDSLNEHNRYYYDLMSIKARDKAYLDITTDTTITDIIAYFERRGSENELGEAYYYGGRVSREQGDAPQALDYYQKALDVLTSPEHMYRKGKIASQMGQIFLELYMFEQAKPKFQEAIAYQTECEDSVGLMYNYSDLAYTCRNINKFDSALVCYKKSIEFATNLYPNGIDEVESRIALVDFLMSQKDYEQAIKEYRIVEPLLPKLEVTNYVRMASLNILLILKDYKKAESIALELLESSSITCKEFAYNSLKEIAEYHNEAKMLYHYTKKYNEILDSINSKSSREAIIHQNSFYNYTQKERENQYLREYKNRTKYVYILSILALLVIVLVVFNFIVYSKKMKMKAYLQEEKIKNIKADLHRLERPQISEKEQAKIIRDNIHSEYLKLIDLKAFNKCVLPEGIIMSDTYNKLKKAVGNSEIQINETDWSELEKLVLSFYPKFRISLAVLYSSISDYEYHICLLIKCQFGKKEISELTHHSPSSVTNTRSRLFEKIFSRKGTASDMDCLISLL